MLALKAWAKSWNINSAYMGTLSSYALVNMMIYFLQIGASPPLVPALKKYVDKLMNVNVNTQLQNYVPKEFIQFECKNRENVGALFVKFFHFWNKRIKLVPSIRLLFLELSRPSAGSAGGSSKAFFFPTS